MAEYYKIMTCPSDNSERPVVFERGYSFLPAANDRAFGLNGRRDGNDYWPADDDGPRLTLAGGDGTEAR